MPTAVIMVSDESGFSFSEDELTRVFRGRWPEARYVPATGRIATVTRGQWQIPTPESYPEMVIVDVDVEGRALSLDSVEDELRAQVAAAATTVAGFPDDGSVVLAEWAADFIPLHPDTTRDELLAQVA